MKSSLHEKNIFLLGTPLHGDFGDYLNALAEMQIFDKNLEEYAHIDIPMPIYNRCRNKLKKLVGSNDVIAISGDGCMGTLCLHNEINIRNMVKDYPNNRIIILPQTVYYDTLENNADVFSVSKGIFSSHKDLFLCLRDQTSYDFAQNNNLIGNKEHLLYSPNMALAYQTAITTQTLRNGALINFSRDRDKVLSDGEEQTIREYLWEIGEDTTDTTTVYYDIISLEKRKLLVEDKVREYASAKIVVTDQLYSMIFAAIAGTPCVALDNKAHILFGVYEWIKELPYIHIAEDIETAKMAIVDVLSCKQLTIYKFDENKYNEIVRIIKKKNG